MPAFEYARYVECKSRVERYIALGNVKPEIMAWAVKKLEAATVLAVAERIVLQAQDSFGLRRL